jgi:hypothetical protein
VAAIEGERDSAIRLHKGGKVALVNKAIKEAQDATADFRRGAKKDGCEVD